MRRWILLPLTLAVLAGVIWLFQPAAKTPAPRIAGTKLFEQVFDKVRSAAVDTLSDQELYRRAAVGMIDELDDPYARLLLPGQRPPPPDDAPVAQGLYLDRRDGVVIVAAVPGSPAGAAGVRPGDRLLGVDSTVTDPSRLDRLVTQLDGPPGTSVILRVRRSGVRGPLALVLVRGTVPQLPALEAGQLREGVAHLRVHRFITGIVDSVRRQVILLRTQGARSVILDLRSTVGGDLVQGTALADLFLDEGKTLAISRSRPPAATASLVDHTASPFATMPLAVLIDGGTAGAAEVAAGALQDHDRAAILGSDSFGRGVTQSTFPLGAGASLILTTSLWLTPSGRQIQRPPQPLTGDSLARPRAKSDGGRVLLGGGGIVPDRQVVEGEHEDLALAEARRILARANTPAEVLAVLGIRQ